MPRSKRLSEQMRTEGRARILSAARHLFARTGFDRCTVAEIARAAGMSKGNIYWHFRSKEEILKAVLTAAFEALGELLDRARAADGSGRDRLLLVVDGYLSLGHTLGGAEATVILYGLLRGNPGRLTELGFDAPRLFGGWVAGLGAILRDAQAEGVLPAGEDPDTLAVHFFGYFNGMTVTLGNGGGTVPDDELRRAVLRLLGFDD